MSFGIGQFCKIQSGPYIGGGFYLRRLLEQGVGGPISTVTLRLFGMFLANSVRRQRSVLCLSA